MATVDIVNLQNQKVGQMDLADEVFAAEINEALLYESVRHYMAGRRAGTAKTKTRHEVAGSGKKLWKQKGTGRARMGSIRSPLWRHGGTTHGPVPRDYSYRLNKKMILGALKSALSAKLRDGELKVVDAFSFAEHKTRGVKKALTALEATKTALLVDAGENTNLVRGSQNLEGVKLVGPKGVTAYDLLKYKLVLISKEAAEKLSASLAGGAK
ncbi:MAG: 50S ribosomal protein L4 [Acidobacteria bacterium]|nr:50S ribosomal protein L4 [Acidobacteriota bacterium]